MPKVAFGVTEEKKDSVFKRQEKLHRRGQKSVLTSTGTGIDTSL